MSKDPIAIIGIGCRFPGGVNDVGSFWKLLSEGREAVSDVPHDRWNIERFFDPETGLPGKSITKRGGFLQEIDQFDAQFFGISPREAPYVDPQHRLLLETAWEAIEDAGIVLDFERGSDVGVFVGISHNEYQGIQGNPWDHTGIGPHSSTGCAHSIAANRISYCFNLRGPSVAMDTACSSALTAVHAACEYIRSNRGDLALAGGVTVMIAPGGFIGFSQASMLSPDGHCKAFDASANGFVRGEGAGMVLLKRLSRALADNDPIYGLIIGTAINQDGHTNGISVPSVEAQSRLVREACADAGIAPNEVGFVEAHGTGTAVGDPIEAHALAEALCQDRAADQPLPIGSVKTNLGHLETAAGVPGLVKALLVLKHRQIPPSLHFEKPNPHIDFATLKLRVPTSLEPFPETNGSRIVGVNSFGFGGANAHVLVAEPPGIQPSDHSKTDPDSRENKRGWPLVLSARSEAALRSSAEKLSAWIDERSKSNGDSPVLSDLVYTLGARRNHHSYRLTLVAQTIEEAVTELNAFATDQQPVKVRTAFTPQGGTLPRVAFVMSGQGPQWWGMGRELFQHEPVFRETVERCTAAIQPWARFDLLEELGRNQENSQLHRTEIAQPAIFALQVSLAALWKSWGVQPTVIVGHSVGEIAAACVAGILSLEDAARVITLRARFMEDCARGAGTMLAIGLDEESARTLIARYDRNVTISAFNGPRSVTLSGARSSLEAIASELELDGVFARFVAVDHPFHHPLMKPASDSLERALDDLVPQQETVPFYSSVTGARCPGTSCNGTHWAHGILQAVRFQPAIDAMIDAGVDVWLEISAHPALAHSIQECLAARSIKSPVLSSSRRDSEHETTLETAMSLHRAGVALDFLKLTPSRRLLSLPTYPWDKSRWWSESSEWRESRLGSGGRGLLEVRLPRANPSWVMRLDPRHMAFLKDHKVENLVIFPAAAFVELVLEAGVQLFEGRPFVIEDFEIRKPLIIPDPPSGIQTELSYNPNDRTFAVWSKLERSPAWSLHVIGSLRSERVDSEFAKATSRPETEFAKDFGDESLERVKVEDYYGYLRDIGLRYGDEFRPIRELAAGNGRSKGKVQVSDAIAARAGEYSLHPVLLDGALQIFSAGAATVERKKTQLKLPVHFTKILFLRSPGTGSFVRAETQHCNDEYVEGKIELYEETGRPCVLVEGFRAISVSGARRGAAQSSSRNVVYHLEWEQTPSVSDSPRLNPVPLTRLREVAQAALAQVIDLRGRSELEMAMAAGDEMAAAQLASALRKMQGQTSNYFSADSLGIAQPMRQIFERLVSALVSRGWAKATVDGFETTDLFTSAADSADQSLRTFISRYSAHLPEALLCAATSAELAPILRGEKDAVHVLFSEGSADLLEEFYGEGVYTGPWLAAIAAAVQEAIRHAPEGYVLRILEVGAGTGGLSAQVLPAIAGESYSYVFSDVSAGFFSSAAQKLAGYPGVEYKTFDIEKPAIDQGFEAGSFDFVIGTNAVHAAKDLRSALRHIYELVAPGGTLAFMDLAHPHLWTDMVFALTSGWWRFEDRNLRQFHPLLERPAWEAV
ncbi:MAG: acyltransferase domain-containing protein, partial [Verrucomicrobia bacterium]|nr:acyltransferase domain-containing protein [Verrucomicrobiota bacterium]